MESLSVLHVTPIYVAILGLLFLPFTLRVGAYRVKNKISLGTGEDPELERRIRGQANFTETVPIALVLLVSLELIGTTATGLHAIGAALVVGRLAHYLGLTELGPFFLRPVGMMLTMLSILVSAGWILMQTLA